MQDWWPVRNWRYVLWFLVVGGFAAWLFSGMMPWWMAVPGGIICAGLLAKHAEWQRELEQRHLYSILQDGERDLVEDLSEAAHNAWLAEKRRRGVTTWPNERGFEQMVPYSECPEDVKEFDRVVIRAIALQLVTGASLSRGRDA